MVQANEFHESEPGPRPNAAGIIGNARGREDLRSMPAARLIAGPRRADDYQAMRCADAMTSVSAPAHR